MQIDYSKHDEIDINNQLFRRARNNISENKEAIKDLDDDEKSTAEKNLLLYGSEFINNLKQINYTFEQIERYIFIKSKVSKKTIKKVISETKSTVADIRKPIEEELLPLDDMPELEGDKDFMNYKFIDRDLDLDLKEYEQHYEKLQTELEIIGEQLTIMMGDEDIEDATEIDEKGSQNLIDLKNYINKLLEEDDYLIDKIKYLRGREREDILEEAKATPLPDDEDTGAGRYRGGAKKRGRPKKQQTIRISATTPATATPTTPPIIDVGDPELIEEEDPEAEIRKNEKVAEKLDELLVETVNIEDSTPSQTYIAKANELTTGLIQFLGRTTVLYITRIKKNLNYMDEDQIKIIVDNYTKLKPNLDKLNYYKNTGGALIKETLYNQLTKETLGLYNEINDSIRNVKKIKNYTIFSGAGMNQYRGGYFIQSDNPFIMHTTTKRFL
jgi:hypothetical protein